MEPELTTKINDQNFYQKFTLGGLDEAFRLKNEQRVKFNLPIIEENPDQVINKMSPATPPPNPSDLTNDMQFSNPHSSYKRKKVSVILMLCLFFFCLFLD